MANEETQPISVIPADAVTVKPLGQASRDLAAVAETQPIPTLADWGRVKEERASQAAAELRARIAQRQASRPAQLVFQALTGDPDRRGPVRVPRWADNQHVPDNAPSADPVGVVQDLPLPLYEVLASVPSVQRNVKRAEMARMAENMFGHIIWYGHTTSEFWIMVKSFEGHDLRSFSTMQELCRHYGWGTEWVDRLEASMSPAER